MAVEFTHLHVHSEYSLLDGHSHIKGLVKRAKELGMKALALTDHGAMYGTIEFYQAAKDAGIKPIIGCLLAGQEIITSEGVKNVEDIQVGDYVLTHKGRFRRVSQTMHRHYQGRAYTISLSGRYGRTLTLTEEHPLLVRDRNGTIGWCKPGDIIAGRPHIKEGTDMWNTWACLPKLAIEHECIDVCALLPDDFAVINGCLTRSYTSKYRGDEHWSSFPTTIQLDYDFGYLLGIYAAEGSAKPNGEIDFTLNESEMHIAERLVGMAKRWGLGSAIYPVERNHSLTVRIFGVPLALLFLVLCGKGAQEKRVPVQILTGPHTVRDGFLTGILDGDGRNPDRPSNHNGRQDFKTASRSLAWGVRSLLADKGYWSCINSGEVQAKLPSTNGEYSNKTYRYHMLAYIPNRTFCYTQEDEHSVYRPISSVIPIQLDTDVYNFAVEEDNSYVSDFILHNCEAYLSPKPLGEKTGAYEYSHLLLLAENEIGYRNLLQLTTTAHTKGYTTRPRLDKALLEQYSEGIMATSSCLSGEIPHLLLKGDINGARQTTDWYRQIFGDRFYLEVQEHHGDGSDQTRLNQMILDIHRETGIPLLATNDLHYVHAEDAIAQDLLLCVQTGKTVDDPKRMRFDSNEYYLKSADEMAALFAEMPTAISNTMAVAERCNIDIPFGEARLPDFPIPAGYSDQQEYLYKLCEKGLYERFGSSFEQKIWDKLNYELNVINSKGFTSYFLIVWDYTNYARSQGIRCLARGSAAGSLVSYALGITNVDPLRFDLLFERFLNPDRKSMPDIDMDFPDDRREEIIRYVADTYGVDKVAQIVTFGTMAAKQSIRDVGRVLSMQSDADRVARMMPTGPKVTLESALEDSKELAAEYHKNATVKKIYDLARSLEGSVRSTGVHAAAVVIARDPLVQVLPLQLRDPKDPNSWLVTQYEQAHIESLGLLKMDFLGLSNLSILQNTRKFIKETRDIDIDLDRLPTDTPDARKAFELLGSGETTGIFQFESGAMRRYLQELKPTCIEDLTAMVALYRPGPMDSIPKFIGSKHGKIATTYLHPRLEKYLKESYGVIVYQDQVLLIAVDLAGFTWLEVDAFRKAMGKKQLEVMAKYKEKFIAGCVKNGITEDIARTLYDLIEPFSGYGFNKAHACAYAWVAYQTAYLKANFTAEYMAATMTTESSDTRKVVNIIDECHRMNVHILPPDVNKSDSGFTVVTQSDGSFGIRFGLSAIKNIGSKPIDELIGERQRNGRYRDIADLATRIDAKAVTRSAIEVLIKAGALDTLGRRTQLLDGLDRALAFAVSQKKMLHMGQSSLFGGISDMSSTSFILPDVPDRPQEDLLAMERELLGFYLSSHPLTYLTATIEARTKYRIAFITEEWAGQTITLGGRIVSVRTVLTKKGQKMAIIQFEDLTGPIEIPIFPKTYAEYEPLIQEEKRLFITGKVTIQDEQIKFTPDAIEEIVALEQGPRRINHLQIRIPSRGNPSMDITIIDDIMRIIHSHPGNDTFDLVLAIPDQKGHYAVLRPRSNQIDLKPEVMSEIELLLGSGAVHVLTRSA